MQGGTVNISATDGDLHAKGLKLQGTDVSLSATRDITLEAATNTSEVHSSNSGHNYGGGVTIGFGQQNGVSFQLSAGQSAGKANGTETTYDNTLIEASNSLKITSGRDTTLSGAQLKSKQIDASIGGDFNITTLQDTSWYESKQSSSGLSISLCIPPICYGQVVSGNVQLTRDTINHNYQSAVGQSGIFAGDGGFNIIVSGNTTLKGGALASGNLADSHLRTASLSYEDLTNKQSTQTSSMSVSASYGSSGSLTSTLANNAKTNALGNASSLLAGGNKNSNESSQTLAYIQGNVDITGTGDAAVDAKSRAAAGTLTSRNGATANGALTNNLTLADAGKLQQELQTERENARAAQLVGQVTTNAIGDLAKKEKWDEGSWQKTALHGMAGAIEAAVAKGNIGVGALAGATNEQLLPVIEAFLKTQNITEEDNPEEFKALMKAGSELAGMAVGALASGGDVQTTMMAGSIAVTATENNRLLHPDERKFLKSKAAQLAEESCKGKGAACTAEKTQYWNDLLMSVAEATTDSAREQMVSGDVVKAILASKTYSSEGYVTGSAASLLGDVQKALDTLKAVQGNVLLGTDGKPISSYGSNLTWFSGTDAQRNDHGLYGVSMLHPQGQVSANGSSNDIYMPDRWMDSYVNRLFIKNGSAEPVYPEAFLISPEGKALLSGAGTMLRRGVVSVGEKVASSGWYTKLVEGSAANTAPRELYRLGETVSPLEKTFDHALSPQLYVEDVAAYYRINLRGSGQKISVLYDETLPAGQFGVTREIEGGKIIRVGPDALVDQATTANTIAHELSHARDYLRGIHKVHGNASSLGDGTVYGSGNALEDWIKGNR